MRDKIGTILRTVTIGASALLLSFTGETASAQESPIAPPMECYFFRQSKAPIGPLVNLYTPKPGTLFGQATIDTRMSVQGTYSEGKSSGSFKGRYFALPPQFDVTGSVAFGYQDDVKMFTYSGTTKAQVKSLPGSPIPTRNVDATRFAYRGFVAYCISTEPEIVQQPPVFPASCVFYAKPDVSGYFFGSLDGNLGGAVTGQICLSGSGCVGYGVDRRVDLSAQVLKIPLPDGSGSISYDFTESFPGGTGSAAKEVRFYRSLNSAPLPEHISCTVWASNTTPPDSGGGGNNMPFPPPPSSGGGPRPPPSGM